MTEKEAVKRLEKQYKRQNQYIKDTYDRISVTLPKGTKERIKATGNTVNGLINALVLDYLTRTGSASSPGPDPLQSLDEFPPLE